MENTENIESGCGEGKVELDYETKQYKEDPKLKEKLTKILLALNNNDVKSLKQLAIQNGGLLTDHLRRKIWPILLGIRCYATSPRPTDEEIQSHPSYSLVVMDVQRSLKRFPPSIDKEKKTGMLDELVRLIMRILIKNPDLNYYQGFHDICITFLLVLGEEQAFIAIEKLSKSHFKIFLQETMESTVEVLSNVYLIIKSENKELFEFLLRSEVGVVFSLSWLITWYGHVLTNYEEVVRLFDLFLVSHPIFPIYITTSIVLKAAKEVMGEECNLACVHACLSTQIENMDIEKHIDKAKQLFQKYPPDMLSNMQDKICKQTGRKFSHLWYSPVRRASKSKAFIKYIAMFIPKKRWTITVTFSIAAAALAYMYHINQY